MNETEGRELVESGANTAAEGGSDRRWLADAKRKGALAVKVERHQSHLHFFCGICCFFLLQRTTQATLARFDVALASRDAVNDSLTHVPAFCMPDDVHHSPNPPPQPTQAPQAIHPTAIILGLDRLDHRASIS